MGTLVNLFHSLLVRLLSCTLTGYGKIHVPVSGAVDSGSSKEAEERMGEVCV